MLKIDPSNPKTFARMKKEGRGQGHGESYKPWLTVRDLSSRGVSCRLTGWRSGKRVVHLFSKLERDFFFRLEWDPAVVEIREQYPLDLAGTVAIADENNWYHPTGRKTGLPMPMTSDFLVTRMVDGEEKLTAYYVKPRQEVELSGSKHPTRVKNNLAKLRLEREYWRSQKVEHYLVTEVDFNRTLAQNVREIHSFHGLHSVAPLTSQDVERVHARLRPQVTAADRSLADLASAVDREFGFPNGSSLKVARHLIAHRRWPVDFTVRFEPFKPLRLK